MNISFIIEIHTRKLGEDTGKDLLVNVGNYLEIIRSQMKNTGRKLSTDEQSLLLNVLS